MQQENNDMSQEMTNIPTDKASRQRAVERWLANCALEGILPTEETLAHCKGLIDGAIDPKEHTRALEASYAKTHTVARHA